MLNSGIALSQVKDSVIERFLLCVLLFFNQSINQSINQFLGSFDVFLCTVYSFSHPSINLS